MVDIKDMSLTKPKTGKPPKKGPNGCKFYVSSKVVDALVEMKRHTE